MILGVRSIKEHMQLHNNNGDFEKAKVSELLKQTKNNYTFTNKKWITLHSSQEKKRESNSINELIMNQVFGSQLFPQFMTFIDKFQMHYHSKNTQQQIP